MWRWFLWCSDWTALERFWWARNCSGNITAPVSITTYMCWFCINRNSSEPVSMCFQLYPSWWRLFHKKCHVWPYVQMLTCLCQQQQNVYIKGPEAKLNLEGFGCSSINWIIVLSAKAAVLIDWMISCFFHSSKQAQAKQHSSQILFDLLAQLNRPIVARWIANGTEVYKEKEANQFMLLLLYFPFFLWLGFYSHTTFQDVWEISFTDGPTMAWRG